MIGVLANDGDMPWVAEFFELFKTPWERVVRGRHYDVVQYLLETRKVNFLNKDMRLNALIWAGSTRNAELIEELEAAIHAFFEGK